MVSSTEEDDSSSDSDGYRNFQKGKKRRKLAELSDQDNSPALLQACEDENVLPVVNSSLVCTACERTVEKPKKHVIECCSCLKKFHATCKEVDPMGNRRKLKIMPCKTNIEHFNDIMRYNDAWLGGKFSWTCSSCVTIRSIADKKYTSDRLGLIEAMLVKDHSLKATIESLIDKLNNSSLVAPPAPKDYSLNTDVEMQRDGTSSGLTSSRPSFADMTRSGSSSKSPSAQPQGPQNPSKNVAVTRKSQANKNFRVRITSKSDDAPYIGKVLDKMKMDGSLGKYDARSRGKHSMDLLFENREKAKAEFDKVKGALADFDVHDPELINGKKAFLVGLESYHKEEYVLEEIKAEYGDILS